VLRVGSPGSLFGVSLAGVGAEETSPGGVGDGDESGVWGKACIPASGVEKGEAAGVAGGDESGTCGIACDPASGVEMGDAVVTWARIGHVTLAARHPTTRKRFFTGTNFLIGILVQHLWATTVWPMESAELFGLESNLTLAALLRSKSQNRNATLVRNASASSPWRAGAVR
jgi:hypothetical protein